MTNIPSFTTGSQGISFERKPNNHQKSPHFSGESQETKVTNGDYAQNTTMPFRYPEQFLSLPDILNEHFPEGCTIYDYACSDGSEPYSITMVLNQAGLSDKYPIMARDLSPPIIALAQSGYLLSGPHVREYIESEVPGLNPETCFEKIPDKDRAKIAAQVSEKLCQDNALRLSPRELRKIEYDLKCSDKTLYKVSPELARRIQFQVGDISADPLKIKKNPKPSVILFNTVMQHLKPEQQRKILQHVYKSSAPGSLLFIGDGNRVNPQMAQDIGFEIFSNIDRGEGPEFVFKKPSTETSHWFSRCALRIGRKDIHD